MRTCLLRLEVMRVKIDIERTRHAEPLSFENFRSSLILPCPMLRLGERTRYSSTPRIHCREVSPRPGHHKTWLAFIL